MEYKVLTVRSSGFTGTNFEQAAEELGRLVNEHLSLGWQPQGGLAVGETQTTKEPYLFQALIKK
jgi:hypothetical protein